MYELLAGANGIVYIDKYFSAGESIIVNKGYGLLIVNEISRGISALYSLQNGSHTLITGTEIDYIEIKRVDEFSILITNNFTSTRKIAISAI